MDREENSQRGNLAMEVGFKDPALSGNMTLALLQTWGECTQNATLQCPNLDEKGSS